MPVERDLLLQPSDRELARIKSRRLPDAALASLLGDTARAFYRLPER